MRQIDQPQKKIQRIEKASRDLRPFFDFKYFFTFHALILKKYKVNNYHSTSKGLSFGL